MGRLARWLVTMLSAGSLLLCVAVCVLWARSHLGSDWVTYRRMERTGGVVRLKGLELWTGAGNVALTVVTNAWEDEADDWRSATRRPEGWSWERDKVENPSEDATAPATLWPRLGFAFERGGSVGPYRYRYTTVAGPLWLPALLSAVLPASRVFRRMRRRRRTVHGRCTRCGYDLRASPGRCPECGMEHAG